VVQGSVAANAGVVQATQEHYLQSLLGKVTLRITDSLFDFNVRDVGTSFLQVLLCDC